MKKFFYLCMLALAPMFTFVACGDDDEDAVDEPQGQGEVIYDNNGTKVTEYDNQLVMTSSYEDKDYGKVNVKAVAVFANDACTKATYSETYTSEKIAKEVYEDLMDDLDDDEPNIYTRSGSTVTSDITSELKGFKKDEVKAVFLEIVGENGGESPEDLLTGVKNIQFNETDEMMSITYQQGYGYFYSDVAINAYFSGDECTRFILEETYPNEAIAQEVYENTIEDADEDERAMYSIKGSTIYADMTDSFAGATRDVMRQFMQQYMAQLENQNNSAKVKAHFTVLQNRQAKKPTIKVLTLRK